MFQIDCSEKWVCLAEQTYSWWPHFYFPPLGTDVHRQSLDFCMCICRLSYAPLIRWRGAALLLKYIYRASSKTEVSSGWLNSHTLPSPNQPLLCLNLLHVHAYTHATPTHTSIHAPTHARTQTHAHTHTHTHFHTHTHTHMHAHTHTHTHAQLDT